MTTYVAFLRAINVGGHAIVKMTDLRDAFAAAACKNVRTLIQSGNVVFDAAAKNTAALFQRIRAKLRALLGEEPGVFFRTVGEIDRLAKLAPFKRFAARRGIKLYVAFLLPAALGPRSPGSHWDEEPRGVCRER